MTPTRAGGSAEDRVFGSVRVRARFAFEPGSVRTTSQSNPPSLRSSFPLVPSPALQHSLVARRRRPRELPRRRSSRDVSERRRVSSSLPPLPAARAQTPRWAAIPPAFAASSRICSSDDSSIARSRRPRTRPAPTPRTQTATAPERRRGDRRGSLHLEHRAEPPLAPDRGRRAGEDSRRAAFSYDDDDAWRKEEDPGVSGSPRGPPPRRPGTKSHREPTPRPAPPAPPPLYTAEDASPRPKLPKPSAEVPEVPEVPPRPRPRPTFRRRRGRRRRRRRRPFAPPASPARGGGAPRGGRPERVHELVHEDGPRAVRVVAVQGPGPSHRDGEVEDLRVREEGERGRTGGEGVREPPETFSSRGSGG